MKAHGNSKGEEPYQPTKKSLIVKMKRLTEHKKTNVANCYQQLKEEGGDYPRNCPRNSKQLHYYKQSQNLKENTHEDEVLTLIRKKLKETLDEDMSFSQSISIEKYPAYILYNIVFCFLKGAS